jgi:hypothetical protein
MSNEICILCGKETTVDVLEPVTSKEQDNYVLNVTIEVINHQENT